MNYGNGDYIEYTYNRFGDPATIAYNGTVVAKNFADSSGLVTRSHDLINNLEHRVTYDTTGRLISKDVLDLSVTGNAYKWISSSDNKKASSQKVNWLFTWSE